MAESGVESEGEGSSGLSSEEEDWDNSYDYTGEESGGESGESEGEGRGEYSDGEESKVVGRGDPGEDWQYCEQGVVPRRVEPPQVIT